MTQEQIKNKLKELEKQTHLLQLSNHTALQDHVVVVPAEIKEPGITSRAVQFEDRPDTGLVVAVGPEAQANGISEGDVVFFGKYSHFQVTHDDIVYLILRAEDIYLVAK